MAYRDNVNALCHRLSVSNPIEENILKFSLFVFDIDGKSFQVEATEMNRAGRLYLQDRLAERNKERILILDKAEKWMAQIFFTSEMWGDCSPERRTLIYGIKTARSVLAVSK